MTAPLRASEPIDRRGGARRARLRHRDRPRRARRARHAHRRAASPARAAAIVTDETVARAPLARCRGGACAPPASRRRRSSCRRAKARRAWPCCEHVCEALLAARIERNDVVVALGGGVIGDLAGFAAAILRRGLDYRAGADHAAGAGRFLGRRQDRHQFAPRQESGRRVPSADPGDRRHRAARHACRARDFRAGYAEVAKFGLLGDAGFFAWLEANWRDVFAGGSGARARHRGRVPRQGRDRGARRARDRRARAAQSRPHLRPCVRGGGRLFRHDCCMARRSRSACVLRVRVLRPARPAAADDAGRVARSSCRGRPADPASATMPARRPTRTP